MSICGKCAYYADTLSSGVVCTHKAPYRATGYLTTGCEHWTDHLPEQQRTPVRADSGAVKTCPGCGRSLPLSSFNNSKKSKDGLQPFCRECQSAQNKEWREKNRQKEGTEPRKRRTVKPSGDGPSTRGRKPAHPSYVDETTGLMMKWCYLCQTYKSTDKFYRNHANKDGCSSECKECANARVEKVRRKARQDAALYRAAAKQEEKAVEPRDEAEPITTLANVDITEIVAELRRRGLQGVIYKDGIEL